MKTELIIFDMDGTLVDSEFCAAQTMCDVLPGLNLSPNEIVSSYRGVKLAVTISELVRRYELVVPVDIIDIYRKRETELAAEIIKVNPGVIEFLNTLNIRTCIASNAPKFKTERSMRICGLESHFENRVYSAYDIESWKPEPTLFLHAAESEGYSPEQCLVIEDSETGIAAALAANMRAVLYNPNSQNCEHMPVPSVSSFGDIANFIE